MIPVPNDAMLMKEFKARVTNEFKWHEVVIPAKNSGSKDEIRERVDLCDEQFGRCALSKALEGNGWLFDPSADWAAFSNTKDTGVIFCFKDPNAAALFKIARA